MTLRQRWARQPQSVWFRKATFQVHMWTGIGVGLYMLVISVSGSAVVFRAEWNMWASSDPPILSGDGPRLTEEQLKTAAVTAHPGYIVTQVFIGQNPDTPPEIWMEASDGDILQRLFHPYTGADMGDAIPFGITVMSRLVDLHDNLLADSTGRTVNGIGAILLTLLCLTGAVIWWPGTGRWRRSMGVRRNVGWKRWTWDLHSAIGFWMFALLFIWAVSGIYMAFPRPFAAAIDFLDPPLDTDVDPRPLDVAIQWLTRLHFGRQWGVIVKAIWVVLGLAPACLFITGAVVWWNRVIRPGRQSIGAKADDRSQQPEDKQETGESVYG
jgi:uncharacterized iron-regulated membrane protein